MDSMPRSSSITKLFRNKLPFMQKFNPEHFYFNFTPEGCFISETVGEILTLRMKMTVSKTVEEFGLPLENPKEGSVPYRVLGTCQLTDGTHLLKVINEFDQTEKGTTVSLTIVVPAGCPEDFTEGHKRHFAIEFNNWIRDFFAEKSK
jgi:hypothetical protein